MRRPVSTRSSVGMPLPRTAVWGLALFDIGNYQGRQMQVRNRSRATQLRGGHRDRLIERVGRLPSHPRSDLGILAAGRDDAAEVLASRLAPVPHVERMHAVIGVPITVHVDVG